MVGVCRVSRLRLDGGTDMERLGLVVRVIMTCDFDVSLEKPLEHHDVTIATQG